MRKSKKLLSLILAVVLALALSVTALASWNQFQGSDSHNGVASSTPPLSEPEPIEVDLPNSGAWTGVDAESVISNGYAYTLYNGGTDGSRLQKTNLSSAKSEWNICLSSNSLNVSQLSTPYIDGTNLYAAVTYYGALTPDGDIQLDGEAIDSSFTVPVGTSTVTISGYRLPSDYRSMQIDTGIKTDLTGLTASAIIRDSAGHDYELGDSKSYGGEFIMYNVNGCRVPEADGYKLIVTFNNDTGEPLDSSGIDLLVPSWELYKVNTSTGTKASVAYGRGQANSPITSDSSSIYFGIYDGDHCFYQFPKTGTSIGDLVSYTPHDREADFYNTGAAVVSVNGTDYAVFGCDNGNIYVRPTANFASGSGTYITLISEHGYPTGPVRSTIVVYNDSIYFSSKGESVGLIWRIPIEELMSNTPTVTSNYVKDAANSTSTPAISDDGILFVGTSYFDEDFVGRGTVQAFRADSLDYIDRVYEGDAVQSSPVVYCNDDQYYVYFTTNSSSGAGYCYSFDGSNMGTQIWTAGGTSGNRYSLHGFSSDSGYLVYGDDGNRLYIMS